MHTLYATRRTVRMRVAATTVSRVVNRHRRLCRRRDIDMFQQIRAERQPVFGAAAASPRQLDCLDQADAKQLSDCLRNRLDVNLRVPSEPDVAGEDSGAVGIVGIGRHH